MLARVIFISPGYAVVSIAVLVFAIWVAVDASKYPEWAFQRAGTQKWLYQVLVPISGLFCGIIAIVFGIIWLASKKAQVEQATRGGGDGFPPGPYGTGPPPQPPTWGSPPPPPPGPGPSTPPPPAAD